jgi:hypothetical protein
MIPSLARNVNGLIVMDCLVVKMHEERTSATWAKESISLSHAARILAKFRNQFKLIDRLSAREKGIIPRRIA